MIPIHTVAYDKSCETWHIWLDLKKPNSPYPFITLHMIKINEIDARLMIEQTPHTKEQKDSFDLYIFTKPE